MTEKTHILFSAIALNTDPKKRLHVGNIQIQVLWLTWNDIANRSNSQLPADLSYKIIEINYSISEFGVSIEMNHIIQYSLHLSQ